MVKEAGTEIQLALKNSKDYAVFRSSILIAIAVLLALNAIGTTAEAANCTWLKRCVIKDGQQHCGMRKICRAGP